MTNNGVQTLIHYPIPPHKQVCYPELSHYSLPITEQIHEKILNIPISPVMTDAEVQQIIKITNSYKNVFLIDTYEISKSL